MKKVFDKTRLSTLTLPGIVVLMAVFLIRAVGTAYFVIGLYVKLHTGVLDDSVINVLDSVYVVGNLPLGTTVNVLVLSLVSLFPVYLVVGMLGILGALCRNKVVLIINMVIFSMFICLDIVYIVFFSILYHKIDTDLGTDLQHLYDSMLSFSFADAFGLGSSWRAMFNSLKCCSVRYEHPYYSPVTGSNLNDNFYCSYTYKLPCWVEISKSLHTYCATFIPLAILCFIMEVILIIMSDYIYGDIQQRLADKANEKRETENSENLTIQNKTEKFFPFAIGRTVISVIKSSWQRSGLDFICNSLKATLIVLGIILFGFGLRLHVDEKMSGEYVISAYALMFFKGYSYRNIIYGFAVGMTTLGCLTVFGGGFGLLDIKWMNKTKSKIYLTLAVISVLSKLLCIILWAITFDYILSTMEYKFSNLVREYYDIPAAINRIFVVLNCCGARVNYDVYPLSTSGSRGTWNSFAYNPDSCCKDRTTKNTRYSYIYTSSISGLCSLQIKSQACVGVIEDMLRSYSIAFFVLISMVLIIEVLIAVITIVQIRRQSRDTKDTSEPTSQDAHIPLRQRLIGYLKTNKVNITFLCALILTSMLFFGIFLIGVCLRYDELFTHDIIVLLWNEVKSNDMTYTYIIDVWNGVMIAFGVFGLVQSFLTFFGYRMKSKCLNVTLMVFNVLMFVGTLVAVSWISATVDSMRRSLRSEMTNRLSYYSEAYSYTRYSSNIHGAWNNLFAVGECCGVNYNNDTDFGSLNPSSKIPIYCCTYNPTTDHWVNSYTDCTQNLWIETRHTDTCSESTNKRLQKYEIPFIVFSVFIMALQVLQFLCLMYTTLKSGLDSLKEDKVLNKLKGLFKSKGIEIEVASWIELIFKCVTLVMGISTMIFGIVLMHDDKMTGSNVEYMYLRVYALGVRLTLLFDRLFIITISCGVIAMALALLGISDIFKNLAGTKKTLFYIILLVLAIISNLIFIFLWIPFHSDIAWNSRYQMDNIFRQWFITSSNIFNRFHIAFSCCGIAYTDELYVLAREGWYDTHASSGKFPGSCCDDYTGVTGVWYYDTRNWRSCTSSKPACHGEFMGEINKNSAGYYVLMSLMTISEILFLVFSVKRLIRSTTKDELSMGFGSVRQFIRRNKSMTMALWACCFSSILMGFGLFLEGMLLFFDRIFSHRTISILWDAITIYDLSFSRTLTMHSAFFMTNGLFVAIGIIFTIFALKSSSKTLHVLVIIFSLVELAVAFTTVGLLIRTKVVVDWEMSSKLHANLDRFVFFARGDTVHQSSLSAAWNYLFATLECCGVTHSDSTDFQSGLSSYIRATRNPYDYSSNTNAPNIPVYCCKNNPLTEIYQNEETSCTTNLLPETRFLSPCNDKIVERFHKYSLGFFILSAFIIVFQTTLAIMTFIIIRRDPPFRDDKILKFCKQKLGTKPADDILDELRKTKDTDRKQNKIYPVENDISEKLVDDDDDDIDEDDGNVNEGNDISDDERTARTDHEINF